MNKHLMTLGGLACAGFVQAHEGHGLPGLPGLRGLLHGHADDLALLLALAAVLGLGLGLWRFARRSGPR